MKKQSRAKWLGFHSVKKLIFDRMAGVTKAAKTSNSTPKCMWILERGELRSKSKCLAQQAFLPLIRQKSEIFAAAPRAAPLLSAAQTFSPLTGKSAPLGEGFV